MEYETEYEIGIDIDTAHLLRRCVDLYLERWPGGDPHEQEDLRRLQIMFTAIILEDTIEQDWELSDGDPA